MTGLARDRRRQVAAVTLRVDAVTADVATNLATTDVRYLLVKGPAIAEWLYAPVSDVRLYCDTDLLVPAADIETARTVLRRIGFSPILDQELGGDLPHSHAWCRGDDWVDLDSTLVGVGATPELLWSEMVSVTETLSVRGVNVPIPGEVARTFHVALHAAQHGREVPGPLRDLRYSIDQVPLPIWRDAAAMAQRLRAQDAFAAGLLLDPRGAALAARLGLEPPSSFEVRRRAASAPAEAFAIEHFRTLPGWGPRVRFAAREVVPSPSFLRWWTPVARRGSLGLAAAYFWRFVWVIARTPAAVRSWRTLQSTGSAQGVGER